MQCHFELETDVETLMVEEKWFENIEHILLYKIQQMPFTSWLLA